MKSFKAFLKEAKLKQKEPSWADESKEYSDIRALQDRFSWSMPERSKLQLFVPKRRGPEYHRYSAAFRAHEFKKMNEEAPPVLFDHPESPPGDNKPASGFWTSTARKMPDGSYTSDWYRFVQDRFPHWQTDYGYLFEIVNSPLVYDIDYAEHFWWWAQQNGKTKVERESPFGSESTMRFHFPWNELAKHFDGAHSSHPGRSMDEFTIGWDVESTVWFKTRFLKYKGAVKLYHHGE